MQNIFDTFCMRSKRFSKASKNQYDYQGYKGLIRFWIAFIIQNMPSSLGYQRKTCPCCGWKGAFFKPFFDLAYVSFGALCPICKSHSRHRGQKLFYEQQFSSLSGNLLYIAQEHNIEYFRKMPNLVVKTSEYPEQDDADYHFDLMNIDDNDNKWDYIICHRVIEHLSDDKKGMDELYRILKPGGVLILSVPIACIEKTIDYGEPKKYESDHYYCYGMDFSTRIPTAFMTKKYSFSELFSKIELDSLSLLDDFIFVCTK